MSLIKRIAKKVSRRFRTKGTTAKIINRPGRNSFGITAVTLWERNFPQTTFVPAYAGTKRRIQREKRERKLRDKMYRAK